MILDTNLPIRDLDLRLRALEDSVISSSSVWLESIMEIVLCLTASLHDNVDS